MRDDGDWLVYGIDSEGDLYAIPLNNVGGMKIYKNRADEVVTSICQVGGGGVLLKKLGYVTPRDFCELVSELIPSTKETK